MRKPRTARPKATFWYSDEVAAIGKELIPLHHRHLQHSLVRVEYLFRSDTPKRGGCEVWGTARKVTSLAAFLHDTGRPTEGTTPQPFFVVTISHPVWLKLDVDARRALVDHELMHCSAIESFKDGVSSVTLKIRPHDLEEFTAIVLRHGLWRSEVKALVDAGQGKLALYDGEPAPEAKANGNGQPEPGCLYRTRDGREFRYVAEEDGKHVLRDVVGKRKVPFAPTEFAQLTRVTSLSGAQGAA